MKADSEKVDKLLRQQAAIAHFGSFALRESDLMAVLSEAARACAEGLNASNSKICRYRPQEDDLLIVAGFGWRTGVVGCVVSCADSSSPQGRAFASGKPFICDDIVHDPSLTLAPFYFDHGIASTIGVLIKGSGKPYGVLEVDNDVQTMHDEYDINFLTGFANVLAEAVETNNRTLILQSNISAMTKLVKEVESIVEQKTVLADELQHRVRNNLQLVYGLLGLQLGDTADEAGRRGIASIARRVLALAQVYDHLLGNGMTRTTDFGSYVRSLCLSLAEVQAAQDDQVAFSCDSDEVILDLDTVTTLGLIVTELVTNSYDHAFPDGMTGWIIVDVSQAHGDGMVTVTVGDNGVGFKARATSKRRGLGLVRRLVQQLSGSITLRTDKGTSWVIRFPTPART